MPITRDVALPLREVVVRASRSSGPGGQHANVTASRIEASFDVDASDALSDAQKARVRARCGPVVRAVAQDARSQARNRELALARLRDRLARALAVPRARHATRPTRASQERRLEAKRRAASRKRARRRPSGDDQRAPAGVSRRQAPGRLPTTRRAITRRRAVEETRPASPRGGAARPGPGRSAGAVTAGGQAITAPARRARPARHPSRGTRQASPRARGPTGPPDGGRCSRRPTACRSATGCRGPSARRCRSAARRPRRTCASSSCRS